MDPAVTPGGPTRETLGGRAALAFDAYRDGDRQRMGDLVDLLTPVLWRTARAQGASTALAEDAVQLAWVQLVDLADTIKDPAGVLSWMVVTVKREAWRLMRQDRRAIPVDVVPEEVSSDPGPEALSILTEHQRILWGHVRALPDRCRELLEVIAFVDRPDYASLAQSLGMPVGSIGPTRGRCLTKLRSALAADSRWSV